MRSFGAFAAMAIAVTVAGCGSGGGSVDAGGFTSSLRHSAQTALDNLKWTPIPVTLTQISATDQVLNTCTVHVLTTQPLVFQLFMDWNPEFAGKKLSVAESVDEQRVRFTWLQVDIPASGATPTFKLGQIPGNVPIGQATRDLESHYGPAFQKPLESCEQLTNGSIYGYAYGTITAPISTSTTQTSTTATVPAPGTP
jgi:hypothetical protein